MFSFSGLPSVRVPSVSVEPFEYTWFTVNHGYFKRFNIHSWAILGGKGS